MSRRVSFSNADPDLYFKHTAFYADSPPPTHNPPINKSPSHLNLWIFKFQTTTATFFRRIRTKLVGAFTTQRRCSPKLSSSTPLVRSRSYAETTLDSQRAEAIEDCIEFLNSSSLQRSNSVESSC